jgi:hypothetical protein
MSAESDHGDIQDRATGVFFAVTLGAAALSLGAGLYAWHRSQNAVAAPERTPQTTEAARNTRKVLQYFLIPLWTAAGIADWLCHRASKIERTTGIKETALHLVMLGEAGLPVLIGLFFEINPLVLGLMISSFFVHEATAMWDVRYAVTGRKVTPLEQHAHSFLEMVPLMAVSLISLLHWPQLEALMGRRNEKFAPLRRKSEPLDPVYAVGTLAVMALFEVAPYLEEAVRDLRTHRSVAYAENRHAH